ncbi:MAG TPA: hypothetical protein VGN98_01470 [Tianweitania sediminis]|jgi:hypothetical protein|nr:hypothetical protein [Tianweitania sediminis]
MPIDIKRWMEEGRKNRFPNAGPVAHFSPESQMITLDAYAGEDLPKAMLANDHDRAREITATMAHELTHWADMVGTIWGRDYLDRIYGLHDLMPGATEADFWRFVDFHDTRRRLTFPEYYQTVSEPAPTHDFKKPWRIAFSAGREIDPHGRIDETRPILFVRFADNETGAPLIRQPLTVGSLLETIAVASESYASYLYVKGKVPKNEQVVALHQAGRSISARLYDPQLTLYTAPVHLFAKMSAIKEATQAYEAAAYLAHLCLNLTADHFPGLVLPESMADWQPLFPHFKDRNDRAFAFATVAFNLEKWRTGLALESWIDAALVKSGLPDAKTILAGAVDIMAAQRAAHRSSDLNAAHDYLLELGVVVARGRAKRPMFGIAQALASIGGLPTMVDGEGEFLRFPNSTFDETRFEPMAMIERDWALDKFTRNLLTGCR